MIELLINCWCLHISPDGKFYMIDYIFLLWCVDKILSCSVWVEFFYFLHVSSCEEDHNEQDVENNFYLLKDQIKYFFEAIK